MPTIGFGIDRLSSDDGHALGSRGRVGIWGSYALLIFASLAMLVHCEREAGATTRERAREEGHDGDATGNVRGSLALVIYGASLFALAFMLSVEMLVQRTH